LYAGAPAAVAQTGGFDVIGPIRHDERNRVESIQDLCRGLRAREALQKLLEDEPGGEEHFACVDSADERLDFGCRRRRIAPERERPDASVYKQAHFRLRSLL
jgi:hypothetical protein